MTEPPPLTIAVQKGIACKSGIAGQTLRLIASHHRKVDQDGRGVAMTIQLIPIQITTGTGKTAHILTCAENRGSAPRLQTP